MGDTSKLAFIGLALLVFVASIVLSTSRINSDFTGVTELSIALQMERSTIELIGSGCTLEIRSAYKSACSHNKRVVSAIDTIDMSSVGEITVEPINGRAAVLLSASKWRRILDPSASIDYKNHSEYCGGGSSSGALSNSYSMIVPLEDSALVADEIADFFGAMCWRQGK